MESSNENPGKIVTFSNFRVNEKEKNIEVPPKAKLYKMEIAKTEEEKFEIDLESAPEYQIDTVNNTISFQHTKGIKTGKIVSNEEFMKKVSEKQNKKEKASGEIGR